MSKEIIIVGYSGHSFVVIDSVLSSGHSIRGYCETEEKLTNPYNIKFLGSEDKIVSKENSCIVAIGDNKLREKIQAQLEKQGAEFTNVIHTTAVVSKSVVMGKGNFVSAGAILNSMVRIGDGVICNTRSVIEHECVLGNYVHIGPGTVLCGNVSVGDNTLIGAGSVIIPNINIGKNVIIGAGTVVVKNVADNSIIKGNPAK